jgi:dihydrofolate reductase
MEPLAQEAGMRKVVLSMMISVDGFIAGPDLDLDWMISPDPEREAEHLEFVDSVDTILIGHGVYHDMVGYWPSATGEFADRVNDMPKFVVSRTPEELAWHNARQLFVDGDLPGSVTNLKRTDGKDIVLYGGVRLAQDMARHGLIDEYRLVVTPVALGRGHPLFAPDAPRRSLSLREARPFASGALLASYAPVE